LFFQADYDEIELQKISYDVILVTHGHYVAEKCHQKKGHKNFPFWAPNQNFWLRQWQLTGK